MPSGLKNTFEGWLRPFIPALEIGNNDGDSAVYSRVLGGYVAFDGYPLFKNKSLRNDWEFAEFPRDSSVLGDVIEMLTKDCYPTAKELSVFVELVYFWLDVCERYPRAFLNTRLGFYRTKAGGFTSTKYRVVFDTGAGVTFHVVEAGEHGEPISSSNNAARIKVFINTVMQFIEDNKWARVYQ